jgi:hypothetical protein
MSAVPTEIYLPDARRAPKRLSRSALAYFALVALAAGAAAIPFLAHLTMHTPGWPTFIVFAGCAAVAQIFVVRTPRNQSYHATSVFLIPAILVLKP